MREKQQGGLDADRLFLQLNRIRERLSHVFDWSYATRPNLFQYTFDQADEASTEWHRASRQQADKAKIQRLRKQGKWADCVDGIAKLRGEVVFTFDNGWTMQQLTTRRQLLEEGNTTRGRGCLRHCIGEGDLYVGQVQSGEISVYSLRSPNNSPFVTITVRGISAIHAKGLLNRTPGTVHGGSGEETTIMRRLVGQYRTIDDYLDAECLMINEFLGSKDILWTGDASPCAARLQVIRERRESAQHARQIARNYGSLGTQNRWRRR